MIYKKYFFKQGGALKNQRDSASSTNGVASLSKDKPSFHKSIEKASIYFGILGVIISTFFAYITYVNTDQIKELKSIVKASTETTSRLSQVIDTLQAGNSSTRSIMQIQIDQLSTSSLLQKKTNAIFELQNAANEMRFKAFVLSLSDRVPSRQTYLQWDSAEQITFFDETIKIFTDIADNPYLLSHKKIYGQWNSLYQDLKFLKYMFNSKNEFDSNWWKKNFPFNETMEKLFAFYTDEMDIKAPRLGSDTIISTFANKITKELLTKSTDSLGKVNKEFAEIVEDFRKIDIIKEVFSDNPSKKEVDSLIKAFKPFKIYYDSIKTDLSTQLKEMKNALSLKHTWQKKNDKYYFYNSISTTFPLSKEYFLKNRNKFHSFETSKLSPELRPITLEFIKEIETMDYNVTELLNIETEMLKKVEKYNQQRK